MDAKTPYKAFTIIVVHVLFVS